MLLEKCIKGLEPHPQVIHRKANCIRDGDRPIHMVRRHVSHDPYKRNGGVLRAFPKSTAAQMGAHSNYFGRSRLVKVRSCVRYGPQHTYTLDETYFSV